MHRIPGTALSLWYDLQQVLGGSFTARASGLLTPEFALFSPDGQEFGRLRLRGPWAAEFRSGDYSAVLESSDGLYRMVVSSGEAVVVVAATTNGRPNGELETSCGGRTYGARVNLLRNLAIASYSDGGGAVRLSGGPTGRSYEAVFSTGDGCTLPIGILLLWYVAANRRRAYRIGSPAGGGRM